MSEKNNNMPENNEVKPRGFSNKKNIIIIALAAALALGGGITAVSVGAANRAERSAASGIQLAERYLSELKYEQAIIEFQQVLEIEPMNVEAYLGLAKAYIGLGDTEKALEILRQGLEMTGDQRIQKMINQLSDPAFGSMGSVTILGTKIDIATTKSMLVFNKELYEAGIWISSKINNLDDPSKIPYYDSVIYLNDNLSYEDLDKISQLSQLKDLEIDYAGLSDLSPLAKLTNLYSLSLQSNQISDITPLAGIKDNLTSLRLGCNRISNITLLSEFKNLRSLDLHSNQISDITPLAGLTDLTGLYLGDNQIGDITSLAGLTNLKSLHLYKNQISDITLLAEFTNLKLLRLDSLKISDITLLSDLKNLTYLELSNNQISDITPLSELTNLETLWLSNNPIGDITPLTGLTNLTVLRLRSVQISETDQARLKEQLPNCKITY